MNAKLAAVQLSPGGLPHHPGPLGRFLPPLPDDVALDWLARELSPGDWVLDPFGASPRLAVTVARAGYRLLVAAHNPIERFLIEWRAQPLAESELRAALADLAVAPRGNERLEMHIRSLYQTECAQCGREIMAEAFIWERDATAPTARLYTCPHCGDRGEHPASQADATRAAQFAAGGMHHARALERVAPMGDPDRDHAQEALATYLPRSVYALFTLINKLDSLPGQRRRALTALLLAALDQVNTLWHYPTTRARPRQLTTPPRFRENNVWLSLEDAVIQWPASAPSPDTELPITHWPEMPPESGGICLYEGPLRDLVDHIHANPSPGFQIRAALGTLPRPNQAYWTLSALWSGWLWGPAATAPFKSVLRRRRYDWAWHTSALHAAGHHLVQLLQPGAPFLGLIGEAESGYLTAALLAAGLAGFSLQGVAFRTETGQAHLEWRRTSDSATTAANSLALSSLVGPAISAAQEYLAQRGEPASYLHLHTAALAGLVQAGGSPPAQPAELYSQVQDILQQILLDPSHFTRFGSDRSPENSLWWLNAAAKVESSHSLADQVEMQVVRYLQNHPGCTLAQIDRSACAELTGLLTPELELVRACLASYGVQASPESGEWTLRPQDAPAQRREDLAQQRQMLAQIGQRLSYHIPPAYEAPISPIQHPVTWQGSDGQARYVFYVLASAVFNKIIFPDASQPQTRSKDSPPHHILVIPGGRASLVDFKLRRNPRLESAVHAGWRILKFRHVRRLAENTNLTVQDFDAQLDLDPLANTDPQIQLL
ncbi:MAG: hypothetical protein AB1894_06655 [Chloroflexota bacterium]